MLIRFKEANKPNKQKLTKQEQDLKNENYRAWRSGISELLTYAEDANKNSEQLSVDKAQKAYHLLAQRVSVGEKVPEFLRDKLVEAQARYNEVMKSKGYPQEFRLSKKTRQPKEKKEKMKGWKIVLIVFGIFLLACVIVSPFNELAEKKALGEQAKKEIQEAYTQSTISSVGEVQISKGYETVSSLKTDHATVEVSFKTSTGVEQHVWVWFERVDNEEWNRIDIRGLKY